MTKNREKGNRKIIFRSELSVLTFRLYQKMTKNSRKKSTIILGSELSEASNEPTFKIHQKKLTKNRGKKSKNYFWVRIF